MITMMMMVVVVVVVVVTMIETMTGVQDQLAESWPIILIIFSTTTIGTLPSFYNDTAYMKEMMMIFGTTTIGNHYVPFYNRRGWRLIAEHDILSRL